ncbi:hypothetical protein EDB80DRAFT_114451 [Ilyonectria destructans]|nr:hypothetical protein EDB80DRAFT_114451 [Ilyonectria destructans]
MNSSEAVPQVSEELWNYLLEDKLQKLRDKDQKRLREMLNYDTFQQSLEDLLAKYEAKRPVKLLKFIRPAVEGLSTFSHAFNSIREANPFPTLGWGVAQLLLESAYNSLEVLSHIAYYLEEFTRTLPRCSDYVALFPHHPRLRIALRDILKVYVQVCIDTATYLKKRSAVNILRVVSRSSGNVKRRFDDAKTKVVECRANFERDVNFAHIEATSRMHKQITQTMRSRVEVSKVTTLPFGRNASFVSRDHVLQQIEEGLYPAQPDPGCGTRSCVIHGMGGVGKTQTGLEFAYRLSKPDCCIFWLRAETAVELAGSFSRIAKVLNLAKDSEIQDQTQLITLAQQWLSKNTNWLLIFDNVIDFTSIKTYWPAYPHGSVIVTTQNRVLKHSSTFSIHLTPMTEEEGAHLLLRYLDHKDEQSNVFLNDMENARAISKELEGLPIAIAHVAGYIDQLGRPLSYFLEQFRERRSASIVWLMDSRTSTTPQYDRTLDTVWDFALSALGEEARSLLDVLAMLNPDSIPEEMLLGETDRDPIIFDQIRIELLSRHLVRPQGDTSGSALAIHRSLQKNLVFRLDKDPESRQKVFERAMKLIRKCFPVQSPIGVPVNHRWATYERYLPHVLALHTIYVDSKPEMRGSAEFADLICDAGYYMWDRNLGWEGIPILETAEKICLLDENRHLRRLRANIGVAIGSLLNTIGISELHRALSIFDNILALRQEHNAELPLPHSQEDQLLLSNAWNDKGWMCLESEDYEAAESHFEKSLEIKYQCLEINGKSPEKGMSFEIAETIKNMAVVRLAQKRSKEAMELMHKALKIIEEDQESGLATVQKFRLMMIELLANSGKTDEAIDLAGKVAAIRESLYRPYHPLNLDLYYIQGILFHRAGRLPDAEKMFLQSLENDVRDPYPDECKARCLYALSEVQMDLGNKEEAQKHRKEAFRLLDQWRSLFVIEVSDTTHDSVLFDHVVPVKCTRLSKYGKLWVGEIK